MKEYISSDIMPIFPVYDRDFNWEKFSKGPLPVIFDAFIYKNMSDNRFAAEFLDHKVIDCHGKEFVIAGRRATSKWLKYLPGSKKFVLEFKESGNIYSLDEMKVFFIDKIVRHIKEDDFRESWVKEIYKMESITELLDGYR